MICSFSLISSKNILHFFYHFSQKSVLLLIALIALSCTASKRFPRNAGEESDLEKEKKSETVTEENSGKLDLSNSELRVSLDGNIDSEFLLIESSVYLFNGGNNIALIKPGNTVKLFNEDNTIIVEVNNQSFFGNTFSLTSADATNIVRINGKGYRGKIQITSFSSGINIVNVVSLEDYVKGVLAKEMPIGKNQENLEALKALAICARTYALQKMKNGEIYFDLYADTRDQVYGGVDAEKSITNKAADETKNLILKYEGSPALVFYHSTCGGHTESSKNVFTKEDVPYLNGVKDGTDPYCKISPRFEWKEKYSAELIVDRLKSYNIINDSNSRLNDVRILSVFDSGRINELEFIITSENESNKSIIIRGNEIRSVLRTADGKSILWSNMFELNMESDSLELIGRGFGHGVGLCQWGAIALSKMGWSFNEILDHYYPGTYQERIND